MTSGWHSEMFNLDQITRYKLEEISQWKFKRWLIHPRCLSFLYAQSRLNVTWQDRIWVEFHLFSANFLPIFRRWYPIRCFSAHMFMDSTNFPPKMVPHPCYKLKHGTSSVIFLPTCLRIQPIFRLCTLFNLENFAIEIQTWFISHIN